MMSLNCLPAASGEGDGWIGHRDSHERSFRDSIRTRFSLLDASKYEETRDLARGVGFHIIKRQGKYGDAKGSGFKA